MTDVDEVGNHVSDEMVSACVTIGASDGAPLR